MIVVDLPPPILAQVESMSARAGMTASSWLAEQIAHAYGTGRVSPRIPLSSRASRDPLDAAAKRIERAARAAARVSQSSEPAIDPIL